MHIIAPFVQSGSMIIIYNGEIITYNFQGGDCIIEEQSSKNPYKEIVEAILEKTDLFPILINIHPELSNMIDCRLQTDFFDQLV
jgi:hypothetical protein